MNNACLPNYVSTRVLPAIDQTSGSGAVKSAIVLTNKPQGDVIVQLTGDLAVQDSGASMLTTLNGLGYARFTAEGKLAWFRAEAMLSGSSDVGRESAIALVPPTDFAVSYVKYEPATGPVSGKNLFRLARVNGNSGNVTWEAKYPDPTSSSGSSFMVLPRPKQGDFLTLEPAPSGTGAGQACKVLDSGSSASVTCGGASYAIGGVAGTDGDTAWIWGAPGVSQSIAVNPLSTSETTFHGNPFQYGGEDAFIVGIRGSNSVGPWISEGDYGPVLGLAALSSGELAVTATGNGFMTFNGGQSLLEQTGSTLFKIDTTTGQIAWRTTLADKPTAVIAAPGGRIAVLSQASGGATSVRIFDSTSGSLLSTLPLPPTTYPVLAAGQSDLFVLGDYASTVDFDPGTGTDKPASSRGVYISRYSF